MDEPGYHARRKAEREDREARKLGKLGGLQTTSPLAEPDDQLDTPEKVETGYGEQGYRPPPSAKSHDVPGAHTAGEPGTEAERQGTHSKPTGATPQDGTSTEVANADVNSKPLPQPIPPSTGIRRYDPHLQVMCGPMLRYDTVKDSIYHAFAMIVTTDANSSYDPAPVLTLEWDATGGTIEQHLHRLNIDGVPHQDPEDTVNKRAIQGVKIHTYFSLAGGQSFWRFKIELPLGERQEQIHYSINGGPETSFFIPASHQNFRWVAHSCNGFSSGVDVAAFNGPDPLWRDVLRVHEKTPVHVLVGGGDQIYCDALTREPEMQEWVNSPNEKDKIHQPMSDTMKLALDRFFFNHYCSWFRSGAFGSAIGQIPMLNICDDHDIIDGFGSYPDDLQTTPVFSTIGARGYFWFLLFQMFIEDTVDGTSPAPQTHSSRSVIFGGEGAYIPFPNRSYLSYLGPKVFILLLDCRSERKKTQICSKTTYDRVFAALHELPEQTEHLVVLLGVPIAYPRMNAIETVLDSKLNPLTLLAKTGSLGLGSFVNKFNKEAELLDDLNDHWTAKGHKAERNWLIEECQKLASTRRLRITYLSGDVHAAAVTELHSTKKVEPSKDAKYMLQIISSAIVNTPPPPPVILMVSTLGKKKHKTLHYVDTDETMVHLFKEDTDGKSLKNTTVMGRRNYGLINHLDDTGELEFSIQVEISQGSGTTKGYAVKAPPCKW